MRSIRSKFLKTAAVLLIFALFFTAIPVYAASAAKTGSAPKERDRGVETLTTCDLLTAMDEFRAPPTTADFSYIRIRLSIGTTYSVDFDLYGSYFFGGSSSVYSSSVDGAFPITVWVIGDGIRVTERNSGETLAEGETVELCRVEELYEAGYAQLVRTGDPDTQDRKYLGNFHFEVFEGSLRIINTVSMAYYLFGVVGYELNIYCQPEALKVQAIASKVYGMFFMDEEAAYDVTDGWDTPLYQAYRGFRENRLPTMPYCLAVVGEAMQYQGTVFPAFYGHTDGGETALPSQIYSSGNPRYDGGYDTRLDDIEFDNEEESRILINIEYGGTGDSSRLLDFILVKARDLFGINPTGVVSIEDLYTFEPKEGTQRNMQKLHVEARIRYSTKGGTNSVSTFTFDCPTSEMRSLHLSDLDGSGDEYTSNKYLYTKNYKMYWGKPTENGYLLIFSRYGQGIGLSQMGAEIRANPNTYAMRYHEILSFYFPNFEPLTITENAPGDPAWQLTPQTDVLAYGIATVDGASLRADPFDFGELLGTLNRFEHFDILGVTDSGWFLAYWRGVTGFITLDESRVLMFPAPKDGIRHMFPGTVKNLASVRTEPFVRDGNRIEMLTAGNTFIGWAQIGKWYYVTTQNGNDGFLSALMVDFNGVYDVPGMGSIPVPEPEKLANQKQSTSLRPTLPQIGKVFEE